MAFATPVRSTDLVDSLRSIRAQKMGAEEWRAAQKKFAEYCFEQDDLYTKIPKDSIYEGQRQFRFDFKARWIEHRSSDQVRSTELASEASAGFSHVAAAVKWYSADKGYGFALAGLPEDVFFHRNILELAKIDAVEPNDVLICDIAPGPKGKLQVIAVHSLQKGQAEAQKSIGSSHGVEGTVEFYNPGKGYGFMNAPTLSEDVYISARVVEQAGLQSLAAGLRVKATIEPGRFGKGFMATAIEVVAPLTRNTAQPSPL
jgi:cold shock protein